MKNGIHLFVIHIHWENLICTNHRYFLTLKVADIDFVNNLMSPVLGIKYSVNGVVPKSDASVESLAEGRRINLTG